MAQIDVYLLMFLIIFVGHVMSSSICYDNGLTHTIYCTYDCCGTYGYQYCCNDYSSLYPRYGVGAIIGIVIGSLAGLLILISVIVCCCCRPCVRATSGQVLQPHPAYPMTSVTTAYVMSMPITQLTPLMYAPSYPFPQMTGGYQPGNAAMNYPYGPPQAIYNPSATTSPDNDNVANK